MSVRLFNIQESLSAIYSDIDNEYDSSSDLENDSFDEIHEQIIEHHVYDATLDTFIEMSEYIKLNGLNICDTFTFDDLYNIMSRYI